MAQFQVEGRRIGEGHPTFFVADISANHDGDLERAKALIHLAARAGADSAKFQNFRAPQIVSDFGFQKLGSGRSHQSKWKKPVFQVYQDFSIPWEWTPILQRECRAAGIAYFSTPYDLETVDMLNPHVGMFKIGSGDLTWLELIRRTAEKGKPILLATGASSLGEVQRAADLVLSLNPDLCLMQCNTNYTGNVENFKHIHLNVLKTYRTLYPHVVLGLSDHTPGHSTVLGAVALGARVVEKHFTDDTTREGPDHPFSMRPTDWRQMVDSTRELEWAMGSSIKEVAPNERETVVVQRRCLRAARSLKAGALLTRDDIDVLRPAPADGIFPNELDQLLGTRTRSDIVKGESFRWAMMEGRAKGLGGIT